MLTVQSSPLSGVYVIEPEQAHDQRGVERTSFHPTQYAAFGMTGRFTSDRHVRSFQGTLRGLYILPADQHMMFNLIRGDVCLVIVDARENSRNFGKFQMIDINDAHNRQVYIPGGMAYGYCVRSDVTDIHEKFTGFYDAASMNGIFWNDRDLNIPWPVKFPLVSELEARFPALKQDHNICV
jgi:dTDP-4-dehydrorhamnose 3,5-epimerase